MAFTTLPCPSMLSYRNDDFPIILFFSVTAFWVIPFQIIKVMKPYVAELANFFTADTAPYEGVTLDILHQNSIQFRSYVHLKFSWICSKLSMVAIMISDNILGRLQLIVNLTIFCQLSWEFAYLLIHIWRIWIWIQILPTFRHFHTNFSKKISLFP